MFSLRFLPSYRDPLLAGFVTLMFHGILACAPGGDTITGRVLHDGRPVAGASVSAYLNEGDFGGGQPFITSETGKDGRFVLHTGRGAFYVVVRKTEILSGRERVLRGRAEGEPVTPDNDREIVITLKSVGEGDYLPDPGTFVTGRVTNQNGSVEGTFVYAYETSGEIASGPSFEAKTAVGDAGYFRLALKEGSFFIVAMKKESGSEVGPMSGSGLRAEYGTGPVVIKKGHVIDVGTLDLKHPDPEKLQDLSKRSGLAGSGYVVRGKVLLEDGGSAPGVFVMAYGDGRMVGRPESISGRSDATGSFILYLPGPGRYFLGARESIGGPLSPGELTGAYEGSPDHSLSVTEKTNVHDMRIIVREKW